MAAVERWVVGAGSLVCGGVILSALNQKHVPPRPPSVVDQPPWNPDEERVAIESGNHEPVRTFDTDAQGHGYPLPLFTVSARPAINTFVLVACNVELVRHNCRVANSTSAYRYERARLDNFTEDCGS